MSNIVRFEEQTAIAKAFKDSGLFPDLKSEAQAEMDRLDAELATQMAGGVGYHFTIG